MRINKQIVSADVGRLFKAARGGQKVYTQFIPQARVPRSVNEGVEQLLGLTAPIPPANDVAPSLKKKTKMKKDGEATKPAKIKKKKATVIQESIADLRCLIVMNAGDKALLDKLEELETLITAKKTLPKKQKTSAVKTEVSSEPQIRDLDRNTMDYLQKLADFCQDNWSTTMPRYAAGSSETYEPCFCFSDCTCR